MAQDSGEVTSTEIRAQIEQTRAEMSETINAIQARLSPAQLMTDAKDSVATPIAAAVGAITVTALAVRLLTRPRRRSRLRARRTLMLRDHGVRPSAATSQALAAAAACAGLVWLLQCSGNTNRPIDRGF